MLKIVLGFQTEKRAYLPPTHTLQLKSLPTAHSSYPDESHEVCRDASKDNLADNGLTDSLSRQAQC